MGAEAVKIIALYFFLLILNIVLFLANNGFISWFGAFVSVCFLLYFAAIYEKPRYRWLVAYVFNGGNGRIFIEADNKKLSRAFILAIEKYLADDVGRDNPAISNIQFLERIN